MTKNQCYCCPDCGLPLDNVPITTPVENQIDPCSVCGAELRDVATGLCIFCGEGRA